MITTPRRRDMLKAALGGGAALLAPFPAFGQNAGGQSAADQQQGQAAPDASGADFAIEALAGSLSLVRGPGFNVLVAPGEDGLTLVDGGTAEHAAALLDFLRAETGAERVETLFNTHWHPEQTGLNETVGQDGGTIIAHENTRLWLSHSFHVWWQERSYEPLPEPARPNRTLYDREAFLNGAAEAVYMRGAHTDGDIFVRFADENVIASGGVGRADAWPVLDWGTGGWIGGMIDGLDAILAESDDQTRIVPEAGPVVSRADLMEQREMYSTILGRLATMLRQSYGFADVLAARPAEEFEAQWGDSEQFIRLAYRGIWGHIRNDRRVSTI